MPEFGDLTNPIVAFVALVFLAWRIIEALAKAFKKSPVDNKTNGHIVGLAPEQIAAIGGQVGEVKNRLDLHMSHSTRDAGESREEHSEIAKTLREMRDVNRDGANAMTNLADEIKELVTILK